MRDFFQGKRTRSFDIFKRHIHIFNLPGPKIYGLFVKFNRPAFDIKIHTSDKYSKQQQPACFFFFWSAILQFQFPLNRSLYLI